MIFCAKPAEDDDKANLIVHRGERCFVILNLYPYTNGHLMIAPYEHVGRIQDIPAETTAEMMALSQQAISPFKAKYEPHGFNVGFNQGRVAGAGVEHHIHMHVVPRWGGDTNFMPVLADTRVMPQTLEESFEALDGELGDSRSSWTSSRPTTSAASTARTWTARRRFWWAAASPVCSRPARQAHVPASRRDRPDMRLKAPEMAGRLRRRA